MKCIKTEYTKNVKKTVKRFSEYELRFSKDVVGKIKVTGYRKYKNHDEIDIIFDGKMHALYYYDKRWIGADLEKISKYKAYRFLRGKIFEELRDYFSMFNVDLRFREDIKKIKWITSESGS